MSSTLSCEGAFSCAKKRKKNVVKGSRRRGRPRSEEEKMRLHTEGGEGKRSEKKGPKFPFLLICAKEERHLFLQRKKCGAKIEKKEDQRLVSLLGREIKKKGGRGGGKKEGGRKIADTFKRN